MSSTSHLNLADLEASFVLLFAKLPRLPEKLTTIINTYISYLVLIYAIYLIVVSGIYKLYTHAVVLDLIGINTLLSISFNAVSAVILFLSIKPLRKKHILGWQMIFYLSLLQMLVSVFSFSLSSLLPPLFCLYILFQLKPFYH